MSNDYQPLTVADYVREAARTDQQSDGSSLNFPLLGLFGETGSLLSALKKKQRDHASFRGYSSAVVEELGDVLWYMSAVCARANISLSAIAAECHPLKNDAHRPEPQEVTFEDLQPGNLSRSREPSATFETTLMQLASEVGALLGDHQASRLMGDAAGSSERIGTIFRLLLRAAGEAGVTLEAAAIKNLRKNADRWPNERVYPEPFDQAFPIDEQLPRTLTIDVFEREVDGQLFVYQRSNGIHIGDRLTDNAAAPDDYRFHDVFHFANAAVLGWSPVLRALLRLKRKSAPRVDEAQDGARAILIEEGLASWLFSQAEPLAFFDGPGVGGLPLDLLKSVRQFVEGYEAEACPLWVWEEAILQGFAAFRFLQIHRRGRLTIDLDAHQLRIEELPHEA